MTGTAPRRRLPALLGVLGIVLTTGLLGGPAAAQPSDPTPPEPGEGPGDPPAAVVESQFERGERLYEATCASCHGQRGEGSPRGPSLLDVGAASVDFQLETGRMPIPEEKGSPPGGDPKLPADDIDALVAYVSSLEGFSGPDIPTVAPGDLTLGRELFLQNCSACHSSSGIGYAQVGGRIAPDLFANDPVQIAEAIRTGPNLMPEFPESVFDDEQLDALVTYVEYLQELDGKGGADIGRVGPVAETIVGFAGLALLLLVIRLLGKRAGR